MKILRHKFSFLLMALCCWSLQAMAGTTAIHGTVTDSHTGEPLPGAHVQLVIHQLATVTSADGSFDFASVPAGSEKIRVSYMGYRLFEKSILLKEGLDLSPDIRLVPAIYNSNEVVITASRTPEKLQDVPAHVTVISRKEIQQIPHQNIEDVLRYAAGINVNSPGGIYSMRPVVTLRGLSGDEQGRTLVLLDGVPLNKGDTGGVNWSRINFDDIERIEIYHGPGSSVYGNNAMGGVINIITREPVRGLEGSARLSYGTYNTLMSGASVGGRNKKGLYFRLSGMYNTSDGYNDLAEKFRETPDYSVPRFLDEYNISSKAGWAVSGLLQAEIQYDHYRNHKGEGEKIMAPDGEYRHFDTDFLHARIKGNSEKFSYDINAFYQHENYFKLDERMKGDQYSRFDVHSNRIDRGILFNFSQQISQQNKLVYGAELRSGSVDGGDYYVTSPDSVVNRGQLDNYALFVQDDQKFLQDRIKLSIGMRYDLARFHDGSYTTTDGAWAGILPELASHRWHAVSPRVALGYRINTNQRLYASWSRGFRASILDDLCRSGWMWVGPKIANPQLGPETIDNFEVGGSFQIHDILNIAPSVFYAKGHDFLYYVATGDSLFGKRPVYQRQNITGVEMYGFGLHSTASVSPEVHIFLNYNYNHSEILDFNKNPTLEGLSLQYTPVHQLKSGFDWQNNWFSLSFAARYKSRQYTTDDHSSWIDPYVTFDGKISRYLAGNLLLYASVKDILDNRHLDSEYYLSPGRLVTVGASYHFRKK